MEDGSIGRRLRTLRGSAYTQQELADAAGVSVDLVRKLEQGRRRTTSIGTLQRLARVLDVDVTELLGANRPVPPAGPDQGRVGPIRDVLLGVDDLLGETEGPDAQDAVGLGRAAVYAWGLYWSGRYGPLAAALPRLLIDARAGVLGAGRAGDAAVVDLATQVHQLTALTLLRLDAADLAYVAASRAVGLGAEGGDGLRHAVSLTTAGYVLLRQGRYGEAQRVSEAAVRAATTIGSCSAAELCVYGNGLLGVATSAVRAGRRGDAEQVLEEAALVAARVGRDRADYEAQFGPSNVVMQTADAAVVGEDFEAAATAAGRMPVDTGLPLAARSRHLTDVAHAQLRLGDLSAAEATLIRLQRAAPEWTAHHALPRLLVGELLTHRRPSEQLRRLAARLQVAPAPLVLQPGEE